LHDNVRQRSTSPAAALHGDDGLVIEVLDAILHDDDGKKNSSCVAAPHNDEGQKETLSAAVFHNDEDYVSMAHVLNLYYNEGRNSKSLSAELRNDGFYMSIGTNIFADYAKILGVQPTLQVIQQATLSAHHSSDPNEKLFLPSDSQSQVFSRLNDELVIPFRLQSQAPSRLSDELITVRPRTLNHMHLQSLVMR
jgi:hypothetical protein